MLQNNRLIQKLLSIQSDKKGYSKLQHRANFSSKNSKNLIRFILKLRYDTLRQWLNHWQISIKITRQDNIILEIQCNLS